MIKIDFFSSCMNQIKLSVITDVKYRQTDEQDAVLLLRYYYSFTDRLYENSASTTG